MIETPRLILRPWRVEDKPAFEAFANTPTMMKEFGGVWAPGKHDELVDIQIADFARSQRCMWAVDHRDTGELIGICGVRWSNRFPEIPMHNELEIGWRIAEPYWGQGLAYEAAMASLAEAWANTGAPRVGAWTTITNKPSWSLMEKLGMQRRPELDFHHPRHEPDDPYGACIVYVIDRP